MTRRLSNWIESYVKAASVSEAPLLYHFWSGVSALSGGLRRHVWFDQVHFQWFPSFYVVFVAKPGVATKSTATGYAMELLKTVPDIHFGPDEITWQELVRSFADSHHSFEIDGTFYPESPITIFASEFGMLMDFQDKKFVNLLITMWDGRKDFRKATKMSGKDEVEAPYVNLVACTTPQWIDDNMTQNTIGGGFTSRCVFVFADKKARRVAHIKKAIEQSGWTPTQYRSLMEDLAHDLEHIATNLMGEYTLTPEAETWAESWYDRVCDEMENANNPDFISNYLSRKQAHLYKLAMIISASKTDDLVIQLGDLQLALTMLDSTESDFKKVFSRVGRNDRSNEVNRVMDALRAAKILPYQKVLQLLQIHFPSESEMTDILASYIKSGQIKLVMEAGRPPELEWVGGE